MERWAGLDERSYCGVYNCRTCRFRTEGTCPGCIQGNKLLQTWGRPPCSVYTCAQARGIENCASCTEPECGLLQNVESICPLRSGLEDRAHWVWRIARHLEGRCAKTESPRSIPLKTLMRLRWYLAALQSFRSLDVISSQELADKVGLNSAMVRKDLSHLGELGTPGLGYYVADLQDRIHGILDQDTCVLIWIGAQWLSNVISGYTPTQELNFTVVAAFDTRPEWIGRTVGEWTVRPLSDLPVFVQGERVDGAVLALPEDNVRVADELVRIGIKGILNLTPVTLTPPPSVSVRHVDLIGEMMALARKVTEKPAKNSH